MNTLLDLTTWNEGLTWINKMLGLEKIIKRLDICFIFPKWFDYNDSIKCDIVIFLVFRSLSFDITSYGRSFEP